MTDDFGDLLRSMAECRVRFLVVGAHALAAHGVPRMTGDLDLWIERSPENAARAWKALDLFGAGNDDVHFATFTSSCEELRVAIGSANEASPMIA